MQQNVLRLDVSVADGAPVDEDDCREDLPHEGERPTDGEPDLLVDEGLQAPK